MLHLPECLTLLGLENPEKSSCSKDSPTAVSPFDRTLFWMLGAILFSKTVGELLLPKTQ